MADEDDVVIEGLHGPYAGQRLTVAAAEAKKAIADGWARDPFAEPQEPKEITDDERQKILDVAGKAARRLRGEEDEEKDPGKKTKETKSLEADKPAASYETKSSKTK